MAHVPNEWQTSSIIFVSGMSHVQYSSIFLNISGCSFKQTMLKQIMLYDILYPIGSMVLVYMLTERGYIDGIHVTIYSSTMDPMGTDHPSKSEVIKKNPGLQ